MDIIIVEAVVNDYLEVNRLVRQGHEEHVIGDCSVFKQVEDVMPESYYNELLTHEHSKIFLAKKEDLTVGFAVISIESSPPFPSLVPRKYAYIHDFGVDQLEKRKGIGSMLFERCLQWAKEMDVTAVELNVWEFNEDAIAFYKGCGMETINRKMRIAIN